MVTHIIMDIGCLECNTPTYLVAQFVSPIAAREVCAALEYTRKKNREGDHAFETFEVFAAMTGPRVLIETEYQQQVDACGVAYKEF